MVIAILHRFALVTAAVAVGGLTWIEAHGETANSNLRRVPARITVKPVFVVPSDATNPPPAYFSLIEQHLQWCQARYRQLLSGRSTFQIATGGPVVLQSRHSIAAYTAQKDMGGEQSLREMFAQDQVIASVAPTSMFSSLSAPAAGRSERGGQSMAE